MNYGLEMDTQKSISNYFGSKCYMKRDHAIGNFDARIDEEIFLRYSLRNKAYRDFNQKTQKIVECTNIKVYEKFEFRERIPKYNSNDEEANPKSIIEIVEIFFETNNDSVNNV